MNELEQVILDRDESQKYFPMLFARVEALQTALADVLSTFREDGKTTVITGERQEAWRAVLDNDPSQPARDVLNQKLPAAVTALQSCARVFEGWQKDANPHGDLKRGESADYDAATDMLEMVREALAK